MFVSNNRALLRLWGKESLVKHQKVSKCYENDCLQNFLLLFMFLLTAKFAENSHIFARIYLNSLTNVVTEIWNRFNTKIQLRWKDWKSSYQIRNVLSLFLKLSALMLGYNTVKDFRVTKIIRKMRFERVCCKYSNKKMFPETINYKTFKTKSRFYVK